MRLETLDVSLGFSDIQLYMMSQNIKMKISHFKAGEDIAENQKSLEIDE